jgi:hypothetical protein
VAAAGAFSISGIVARLAALERVRRTELDILGALAADVAALAQLDIAAAVAAGVSEDHARRLRSAASLLDLPRMTEARAVGLARAGVDLPVLVHEEPPAVFRRLYERGTATRLGIVESDVLAWSVAARLDAQERAGPPPAPPAELPRPEPAEPFPSAHVIVDDDAGWAELAGRFYPGAPADAGIAERLRLANGRPDEDPPGAGEQLVLPSFPDHAPELATDAEAVERLRRFAGYLDEAEAEALVLAGYRTPGALLHASRAIAAATGITNGKLEQLQAQVVLTSVPGVSPEFAYHVVTQEGWGSPGALMQASVDDLVLLIDQGVYTGRLSADTRASTSVVAGWLVTAKHIVHGIGSWPTITLMPYDGPCDPTAGPDRHLENAYSYRFTPQSRTGAELADEHNLRLELLGRVRDAIQQGSAPSEALKLVDEVKQVCNLQEEGLAVWGIPNLGAAAATRLVNAKRYLRDNALIVRLLQALTEGHEAFQRAEYGLALAAYGRAEAMFRDPRLGSGDDELPDISAFWTANAAGVPRFADPTTPGWNASKLDRIAVYYEDRAAGNLPREYRTDPPTAMPATQLLERCLHLAFSDYDRQLLLGNLGAPGNRDPFRRSLYYIANFVLPLAQADIYLELGNYCRALELYFSVYHEPSFSNQLGGGDETVLQTRIQTPAEQAIPGNVVALFSLTTIDTTAPRRYYTPYLHPVEKQVIRIRVAETLRRWGEYHYQRDERVLSRARYAQAIRAVFPAWRDFLPENFASPAALEAALRSTTHNPRVLVLAFDAYTQLQKIRAGRNILNYPNDYVPAWTYPILLNAARYLTEHARQLERDALQALASAESEAGSVRLLDQALSSARSQLAVERRRVDEAEAGSAVVGASSDLAIQRERNSQDRIDELDRLGDDMLALGTLQGILSGAATGAAIGGPYGIAAGAIVGGTSAYLSGQIELQMKGNDLQRQLAEATQASAVATAEVARAAITADVARLQRNLAQMNVSFASSNLEFAQAKTLNADFWFEASRRLRAFAQTYLRRAIEVAFLAEQAFEFEEERRVDRIKFDYANTQDRLAAEALLADLDGIEFERIVSRRTKNMPLRYVVSLRERDFIAFSEFKRTGTLTFDLPLWEFDLVHPGTYHQWIVRAEVVVRALTTASGVRGSLTKAGLSYLRFRPQADAPAAVNAGSDWIQYTPSPYRIAPQILEPETLVLSSFEQRRDGVMLRPDAGELLYAFEGSGVGTTFTLTLSPASNDFDLASIADVQLVLYVRAQFDPALQETVRLERRKLIALERFTTQRSRGYSFRESFPDQFYALQNPTTPPSQHLRRRLLTFDVEPADFPPAQRNRRITGLVLAFPGEETLQLLDVRVTSRMRSPALAAPLTRPTGLNWFPGAAGPGWFHPPDDPSVSSTDAFTQAPEDLWALWLDADANPALCRPGTFRVDAQGDAVLDPLGAPIPDATAAGRRLFDPALLQSIKDVWLVLGYSYEMAGAEGDPITFWAHFSASAQGQRVTGSTPPTVAGSNWVSDAQTGAPAWAVTGGQLRQTVAGAASTYRPAVIQTRTDMAVEARAVLPTTTGHAVGVVARYAGGAAPPSTAGYYLIVTAAAGGVFDVTLDRRGAGGAVLAQQAGVQLVPGAGCSLVLRAVGDRIEAIVDGQPLLRATDAAVASGGMGLHASGTTGAFTDIWMSNLTNRA